MLLMVLHPWALTQIQVDPHVATQDDTFDHNVTYLKIYSGLEVVALILNNRLPIRCLQDFALHVCCGFLTQVPDR